MRPGGGASHLVSATTRLAILGEPRLISPAHHLSLHLLSTSPCRRPLSRAWNLTCFPSCPPVCLVGAAAVSGLARGSSHQAAFGSPSAPLQPCSLARQNRPPTLAAALAGPSLGGGGVGLRMSSGGAGGMGIEGEMGKGLSLAGGREMDVLRDKGFRRGDKVILYDGVCNMCNGWVTYVLKNNKKGDFKFAALQVNAPPPIPPFPLALATFDRSAFPKSSPALIQGQGSLFCLGTILCFPLPPSLPLPLPLLPSIASPQVHASFHCLPSSPCLVPALREMVTIAAR